ncbi:MAG: SMEK domain-containing protein [Mycoplasmoidaceae bacterium]|nr:SMEK domain-containing protein [Mycoplasmoidaceae bacterium]
MKYSKEKLEYVREYLISYKTKIQLSNNSSLLDNARLFENFAAKVLEIIFSKKFINLNEQQNNFPGLDIVSIDNEIYAQVSSQKDIRRKIISTINLISKSDFFANREQILKNLVVVSLNDLDKTNKKIFRINGKLFELNKNLFTINSIITKCSADWDFLNHLFDLCQNDSKNLDN